MSVTLHTNLGDVKIELFVEQAPTACANFLALLASGAYDGTKFHRNIPGFMIQGGDPTGTGKGGDSIWGGAFGDEFHPSIEHSDRGMVSMANKGPNTNKSQFFITYAEALHLDNVYTCFGKVIQGFDVLDKMEVRTLQLEYKLRRTKASFYSIYLQAEPVGEKNRPVNDIILQSATIHANPVAHKSVVLGIPENLIQSGV